MENITQAETHPARRPRTPAERRALWQDVQQVWRKRSEDAGAVIARMRDEWERELPEFKRP